MRRGNVPLRAAGVLLVLVMATTAMLGRLAARYVVADSATDSARAATFSFNLVDGPSSTLIPLTNITKPGDSATYTCTVTGIAEVSTRYRLALALGGSLPLVCTLTGPNTDDVAIQAAVTATPSKTTEARWHAAPPNTPVTKTYTLAVSWPIDEADLAYANGAVGEVAVIMVCEQVD